MRNAVPFLDSREKECPCCDTTCEAPSLLTSMMRYYVCARCAARWQVARSRQTAQDEFADGQDGLARLATR
jgi:formate dehydrogenase maturation protein FdhE